MTNERDESEQLRAEYERLCERYNVTPRAPGDYAGHLASLRVCHEQDTARTENVGMDKHAVRCSLCSHSYHGANVCGHWRKGVGDCSCDGVTPPPRPVTPARYVVRVVLSREELERDPSVPRLLECLRYAGVVQVHSDMTFDVWPEPLSSVPPARGDESGGDS